MPGFFIMDVACMRFSTDDRTFFIAVVSAMSDSTLTNGECEDLHGPKGLSSELILTDCECEDRRVPQLFMMFFKSEH